ncbi:SusC/RagA family TonB-linked outer membrane protein [Croceiramulus getboli]|nr:SusC/RagA family TonB-linked outer membrane protein [Flavobacteriaceae bacterium YJPT1-3]
MKKVLLKSMLLFSALLLSSMAYAQTITVSGAVSEENGPLPGANVIVQGTSNGTTTDFDGNYTLENVPTDATLVFSYVGFAEQLIPVNGRGNINVILVGDNALDEVVLIGYGATTVKDATGSVAAVTSEEFNQGVIQSPEQLIQGKTAGVQISESSGEPGAAISVRIRGSNSIRSGNNPLFVVDGVPLTSGTAPAGNIAGLGSGGSRNPLSFLNPNDIESISILKDASATAIYGSRGANGVIIVQTKSGRGSGKGTWEFNSSVSTSSPLNEYDLLNREQFLEAIADVGNDPNALDFGADSDFQDFYTRTAGAANTNLSYSKGFDTGNLRASFGYSNTQGVVENTAQERIVGRLNGTKRFFDSRVTITGQLSLSRVNDDSAPISGEVGSTGDLIGASITQNPTAPINPNFTPGGNVLNPVSLLANFRGFSNSTRFLGNISAEVDITEELSAKVTVGYDKSDTETIRAFSPDVLGLNGVSEIGRGNFNTFDQENSLLEATLNYTKDFGNSVLDVVAGYSYQEFSRNGIQAQGAGFRTNNLGQISDQLRDTFYEIDALIEGDYNVFGYGVDGTYVNRLFPEIDTTGEIEGAITSPIPAYTAGVFDNTDELQSYFVRANFTLAEKYLFTATARADGSSTFGQDNRYGYFPSGAFAWQIHKEDFMSDSAFSTLKLRLGAGVVGSQEGLGYGLFIQREAAAGGGITNNLEVLPRPGTFIVGGFPNPELQWESTTDYNVGLDFGINNDRFNGTVNVYRKETDNLLLTRELAAPAGGGGTIFSNLDEGVIINQGVELQLNYDFVDTEDVTFSTSFNISYNENDVQDVPVPINTGAIRGNGLTNAFAQRLEDGQPLFSYFMAEFTGFDSNGNPTYLDVDGNGVGDPDADKKFVGEDAQPDVFAGLSLNFRYKRFDASAFFNGQFGFSVYNATANAFFTKSGLLIGKNVTQSVVDNNENPASTVAVSTRFLEKGDFIRMQNASIGYNFPISGEGFLDALRFSITGQNLFLITDYSGLDPEISVNTGALNASAIPTAGIDYASFPRPRTFTFGINARF